MLLLLLSLSLLLLLSFMPDIVIYTVSSPGILATGGSFCSYLGLVLSGVGILLCWYVCFVLKSIQGSKVSAAKGGLFDEL